MGGVVGTSGGSVSTAMTFWLYSKLGGGTVALGSRVGAAVGVGSGVGLCELDTFGIKPSGPGVISGAG